MGAEVLNALEHAVVLQVVDRKWMDHLDAIDQLRQGIGLRAYGQIDPLVAYKKEAFEMFESMIDDIRLEVTRMCMLAQIVERPKERENITSNHGGGKPAKKQPIRKTPEQKIGRNDPCPVSYTHLDVYKRQISRKLPLQREDKRLISTLSFISMMKK